MVRSSGVGIAVDGTIIETDVKQAKKHKGDKVSKRRQGLDDA